MPGVDARRRLHRGRSRHARGDWVARELATRAGIVVASVDYRLCTGGVTYPVPHDNVVAAVRWFRRSAPSLGADADWICLGGERGRKPGSRRGSQASRRGRLEAAQLILAYPGAHAVMPPPVGVARRTDDRGAGYPALPSRRNARLNENYLGGPVAAPTGTRFPALAALEGLCPVLVLTAEYDDLRASGEAFSAALALAGVDLRQVQVKAMLTASSTGPPRSSQSAPRSISSQVPYARPGSRGTIRRCPYAAAAWVVAAVVASGAEPSCTPLSGPLRSLSGLRAIRRSNEMA